MRTSSDNDYRCQRIDSAVEDLARALHVARLKREVREGTYRPDLERLAAVLSSGVVWSEGRANGRGRKI